MSRGGIALRAGYFLVYAIQGAVIPYLSVYLARERGLGPDQIGFVLAVATVGVVVAPPMITLLAEGRAPASRLLGWTLLCAAAALVVFALGDGYWWLLVVFGVFSLFHEPVKPLLDGIFFTLRRSYAGLARASYHRVRIWGSVGYMVPGAVLYFALRWQHSLGFLPLLGCALAVASAGAAFLLPAADHSGAPSKRGGVPRNRRDGCPDGHLESPANRSGRPAPAARISLVATARAACRGMASRPLGPFLLAMFLLQSTMAAYSAFYPLQAIGVVGLPARWLGPLTNLGVLLEIGYIAAFGWFVRVLGWRRFMVLGAGVSAARVAALAAWPTLGAVVGTQLVHGMVIVTTVVGSRVLLDRHVADGVRHAAQGIFAMVVTGGGRVVGNAAGGLVAADDMAALFWCAAAASALAAVILGWVLRTEAPATGPADTRLVPERRLRRSGAVGSELRRRPAGGSADVDVPGAPTQVGGE